MNKIINLQRLCDPVHASKFIKRFGGSTLLAKELGLPKTSGSRTVNNWRTRGIPAQEILKRFDFFSSQFNE